MRSKAVMMIRNGRLVSYGNEQSHLYATLTRAIVESREARSID